MGIARLLAKGWVVFCLFAGVHALHLSIGGGQPVGEAIQGVVLPVLLFTAMGLLFIGGFGASASHGSAMLWRLNARQLIPGFNELVFVGFSILSLANQIFFSPEHIGGPAVFALEAAVGFMVPGQRALDDALSCGLDGGRIFASAFAWLLAIVYVASAISRLRLAAGIIRIERTVRPEPLGATAFAFVLGAFGIVGIQLFFIGTVYHWLSCAAFADIAGALLIGLAPLMLAYLVVAALASALATGPE
jgi:hypothetical protein